MEQHIREIDEYFDVYANTEINLIRNTITFPLRQNLTTSQATHSINIDQTATIQDIYMCRA